MKTERTKKSFFNMSSNFIILIVQTILSFVVRTYFIKILGESNLGLDGLFSNILSMLSLTELGISTAISFILYKPLNDNVKENIGIIMSFYRKMYIYVGIIIFLLGICLVPFLSFIVKDYQNDNMYLIYIIYLLSTVSMYFISYKEILILADQNSYRLTWYNFGFMVTMYLLQILVLEVYHSFILYLVVMLVVKTLQRICINIYISKRYKDINFNTKDKLSKAEFNLLKLNIKSLFFSKVGDYCIYSTDNILISNIVGLSTVGIYTNYSSIVTMSRSLINSIFNGITASFGNLATTEDETTQKNVFEIIDFIGFILYGLLTIVYLVIISPFIKLWLGQKFLLSKYVVILICINFYLMGTQVSLDTIKQACGFYNKDKYIPLLQAFVNLVLSIIFGKKIGLFGILIATTISYLVLPIWNKPYLLYKYIFKSNSYKYFFKQIKNIIILFLVYILSNTIIQFLKLSNDFIFLVSSCIVIFFVFCCIVSLFYFKSSEYQYLINLIKSVFLKSIKRNC